MAKRRAPNVVLLKTPKRLANESVIKLLKEALKEARAGKITQCVLIIENPQDVDWQASQLTDINSMIGMLERAKCELVASIKDEIEDEGAPTG